MKKCTICQTMQSLSHFYAQSSRADGLQSACKECSHSATRQWRARNAEALKDYERARYRDVPERGRLRSRKYYQEHKEARRVYAKTRRLNNPERARGIDATYRKGHPQQRAELERRRRARIAGVIVEAVSAASILSRDKGRCGICGKPVTPEMLTLDHVVPIAMGGEHSYRNLQIAHRRCNERKGARAIGQQVRML